MRVKLLLVTYVLTQIQMQHLLREQGVQTHMMLLCDNIASRHQHNDLGSVHVRSLTGSDHSAYSAAQYL